MLSKNLEQKSDDDSTEVVVSVLWVSTKILFYSDITEDKYFHLFVETFVSNNTGVLYE